jgi:hypothetical protein
MYKAAEWCGYRSGFKKFLDPDPDSRRKKKKKITKIFEKKF